jgi:hypothetical protein
MTRAAGRGPAGAANHAQLASSPCGASVTATRDGADLKGSK